MKFGKFIFKFMPATAAARNATLLLTKGNVGGLAVAMYRAAKVKNSTAWKELAKVWESVGGKPETLYNAIKQGMKVEYKHHPNRHAEKSAPFNFDGYENFEPVTTGAAAATAAPLLVKILKVLKKFAADNPETVSTLKSLAGQGFKELTAKKGAKVTENADGTQTVEIPESAAPNIDAETQLSKSAMFEKRASGQSEGTVNSSGGMSKNTLIIGAIALIAIIYVSK